MGPEKTFENKIKAELKRRGHWYVKYFANRNTRAGVPDLLCCINGRFVAIEVKADKGSASALQLYQIEEINAAGGIAITLYPKEYDHFLFMLDNLEKE